MLARILPMKAVTGDLPPDDERWAYEIKWDGMRLTAYVNDPGGRALRLETTRQLDATVRFPELAGLPGALAGHVAVLDGEAVAFGDDGRPSFGRIQDRIHVSDATVAARKAAANPIVYQVFDIVHLDGEDLTPLPYLGRRARLAEVLAPAAHWRISEHHVGGGEDLLEAVRATRLEGVMAKRTDGVYLPGRRAPTWRKVKVRPQQELVVGGWQPGEGGRAGHLGSLLLGYYDTDPGTGGRVLRYAGRVGTGFTVAELDRLAPLLAAREAAEPPFDPPPPRLVARSARWVRPELVVEVAFAEWTGEGTLRHPSYLGQREDKDPADVVREQR